MLPAFAREGRRAERRVSGSHITVQQDCREAVIDTDLSSGLFDADFRLMVESVTDYGIFLLDPTGHIRTWNIGARLLKGYEAAEVIGKHFSIFYMEPDIARGWPGHELHVARETGRFEDEGWRLRKDGSCFWANVIITRLLGPDGELRGFAKITRDLSERRRQEELLRQSEERFRLLVEGMQDHAIFMLDPRGHVISWNAGAQRCKGYAEHEIIGRHFSIFYPEDVIARGWPEEELRLALRDGRCEDEGWRLRKDGTRFWAGVIITALHDEGGRHRGFAKLTRDLTTRRRISALEDEGRRITTFLAMLGHELRNPLAPIANALSLLKVESEPRVRTITMAREVISRQLVQMTRLVDDLLDVGRITSGKIHLDLKPVKLRDVVLAALETVDPLLRRRRHTLNLDLGSGEVWVCGDRARLVQIVSNLLNNAAKFTQDGGRIGIAVVQAGDFCEIRVCDNGPGIPRHLLRDVFNLFVQGEQDTARSQGGLGLGLSLVQQLVAMHGGEISAFSSGEPGRGAEFVVRLPTTQPASDVRAAEIPLVRGTARHRILVVDDNHDSANTLALLLDSMGYEAMPVYDGPSALAAVKVQTPDVVFLDIGLPGYSGIELARRINAELPNPPPLIAVTGYGQDKDREASADAGFRAHLVKPLQMADLLTVLDEIFVDG